MSCLQFEWILQINLKGLLDNAQQGSNQAACGSSAVPQLVRGKLIGVAGSLIIICYAGNLIVIVMKRALVAA